MIIIDYYKNLSENEKVTFRNEVINLTGWAYSTFYNKFRTKKFKEIETKAIVNLIKQKENVREN